MFVDFYKVVYLIDLGYSSFQIKEMLEKSGELANLDEINEIFLMVRGKEELS